jgi:pyridoxamine 5'-phosphate oxidase
MLYLHNLRRDYQLHSLNIGDLDPNPFSQFIHWFHDAKKARVPERNAMALATSSPQGKPSCRMVLLKKVDNRGFTFFTNSNSRKGKDIACNPFACATIYWHPLERQIILNGTVEQLSLEETDSYFSSRPRGSQLSSWASAQDAPLSSREELEKAYLKFEKQFKGKPIPKPPDWVGYRLLPNRFEFWQGRENRLHDRFCYLLEGDQWKITRLSP